MASNIEGNWRNIPWVPEHPI